MIFMLIAAGVIVVALCLHYSTRSYGLPTEPLVRLGHYDLDTGMGGPNDYGLSDGSDGSMPGDPWGTSYDIWGNPDC